MLGTLKMLIQFILNRLIMQSEIINKAGRLVVLIGGGMGNSNRIATVEIKPSESSPMTVYPLVFGFDDAATAATIVSGVFSVASYVADGKWMEEARSKFDSIINLLVNVLNEIASLKSFINNTVREAIDDKLLDLHQRRLKAYLQEYERYLPGMLQNTAYAQKIAETMSVACGIDIRMIMGYGSKTLHSICIAMLLERDLMEWKVEPAAVFYQTMLQYKSYFESCIREYSDTNCKAQSELSAIQNKLNNIQLDENVFLLADQLFPPDGVCDFEAYRYYETRPSTSCGCAVHANIHIYGACAQIPEDPFAVDVENNKIATLSFDNYNYEVIVHYDASFPDIARGELKYFTDKCMQLVSGEIAYIASLLRSMDTYRSCGFECMRMEQIARTAFAKACSFASNYRYR